MVVCAAYLVLSHPILRSTVQIWYMASVDWLGGPILMELSEDYFRSIIGATEKRLLTAP